MNRNRIVAIIVAVFGIVVLAMGITFVTLGTTKTNYLKSAMRQEKITLGLGAADIKAGKFIDSAAAAQKAADTIRGHRRLIAPTYNALLQGKKYDPTNLTELTYAQALNLENYLYTATVGFGLTTVATVSGVALILVGIALTLLAVFFGIWRPRESNTTHWDRLGQCCVGAGGGPVPTQSTPAYDGAVLPSQTDRSGRTV